MIWSIVDIETTGGHASGNRIIEIAVFRVNDNKIIDRFHTLINPGIRIPGFIISLTGITDEMVKDAPSFEEVAPRINSITSNSIFVAHNVNFDFTFLKTEFEAIGEKFERDRLCTVRLSRKIFPGLPSYSLGNLCGTLGIKIKERHRASGDAEATVQLFQLLTNNDKENFIGKSLKKNSRETLLPGNLPREEFDVLPQKAGVYYFYNQKGKVIYIGKAINIKKRVISHFTTKNKSKQSQNFIREIYSVKFTVCGNELIALLLESYEIKKYWPYYNRIQKQSRQNYGIYIYEDQDGYLRLSIGNVKQHQKPLLYFRYNADARKYLMEKVAEFHLCPRLSGLQNSTGACSLYIEEKCSGACIREEGTKEYNNKLTEAILSFDESGKTYFIKGEGRTEEEVSVVLVESGKYLGYGYVPIDDFCMNFQKLISYVNGHWDNQDIQKILESYIRKDNNGTITFFASKEASDYITPPRQLSDGNLTLF